MVNSVAPYYDQDGITVYCGDCRDVLPSLERGCVDLVLTDPPYNVGKEYGGHNDRMPADEYLAWCEEWFPLMAAVCPRIVLFPGHGNLPVWWTVSKPAAVGCWFKPGNTHSSIIGWEEWEPWLYWRGGGGMIGGSSVIRAPMTRQQGVESQRGTDGHPCPKPLLLFKKLLTKCKSAAVLDPFLGSGTTVVAAKHLGLRAIGIEINEAYCEMAVRRLAQGVLL